MARDYKNAARHRSGKARKAPPWLSFATGLGIGLFVAFVVFLTRSHPARPVTPARVATAKPSPPPTPQVAPDLPEPEAEQTAIKPAPHKPRFDFYTILPEMEVKVPDAQLGDVGNGKAPALTPGVYVLQVGSFQRFEEADKAKATLALHGIVADIQKVVINNGDTWYRVRIGPFKDLNEVQTMRAKLTASGMDFMLLRIKDGQT